MILMRILPGVLKELTKHVPTVLFKTVEWSELASELPKLSRRMLQKEGYEELFQAQKALLDPYNIMLSNETVNHTSLPREKWVGEKILTLYFSQIFSPEGLFLDLRSHHFSTTEQMLKWHPSALWTSFNETFRNGLLKVYDGFYLESEELYYQGLEEIGLFKPDFSPEDRKELGDLFRVHFGGALDEEMSFNLETFRNSIVSMSNFMLNKRVSISKDFLYLGIYLVTMYSVLEELGDKYPVKQIYLDVRGRFIAKEIG